MALNNFFAENIIKFRNRREYSQSDFASRLCLPLEQIQSWERGELLPQITLLPAIAEILNADINVLMAALPPNSSLTIYEEAYKGEQFYWGLVPSVTCYKIMELMPPERPYRLLDIGCGEGRDAVFFAKNGYEVTAFDITGSGIDKAVRLAAQNGVKVNFVRADLLTFRPESEFDIVYSSGVFHYIPENLRDEIIAGYQRNTSVGGLHSINVFVNKPFIAPPPEVEPTAAIWRSGELFTHYTDWLLEECREIIFDCNSSGIAHKHCMDTLIARKMQ